MPKSHPPYAPEFRRQMVELVRSGRSRRSCHASSSQRRKRSGIGCAKPNGMLAAVMMGLPEAERAELARLRRENRQLRQECELLARRRFGSQAEARTAVFRFIEGWYTPARRHSGLGYLSPTAYEEMMQAQP